MRTTLAVRVLFDGASKSTQQAYAYLRLMLFSFGIEFHPGTFI